MLISDLKERENSLPGSIVHQAGSRVHGVQDLREGGVHQAQEARSGQQRHQGEAGETRQREERRTVIFLIRDVINRSDLSVFASPFCFVGRAFKCQFVFQTLKLVKSE